MTFGRAVNAGPRPSRTWTYTWQRRPLKQPELKTVWIPLKPFVFLPLSPPARAVWFYFVLFIFVPLGSSPNLKRPTMHFGGDCETDVSLVLKQRR